MPKYDGINPISKLHPDEPYFFIRAQDILSVDAVIGYAEQLRDRANDAMESGNVEKATGFAAQSAQVMGFARVFERWQQNNPDKVKMPD